MNLHTLIRHNNKAQYLCDARQIYKCQVDNMRGENLKVNRLITDTLHKKEKS